MDKLCTQCGAPIPSESKRRIYCDACGAPAARVARYLASEQGRAYQREWHQSEAGKESKRRADARSRESGRRQEYEREYAQTERGKEVRRAINAKRTEYMRDYMRARIATPEGRLKVAKDNIRKRGLTWGEGVEAVYRAIIAGDAVCYRCGCRGEQADHVLPVEIARFVGIDLALLDEYVAPLCARCHRQKSGRDTFDLRRMRKELTSPVTFG